MLIQQDLTRWPVVVRELIGAGEPLNPEIIEQVQKAWGITIRDGYGQTETTAQVGNSPGQPVKPGSMGRPLPGYDVVLLDVDGEGADGDEAEEGEICLRLTGERGRPLGLMVGYRDDAEKTAEATAGGAYHTGDVASRDADGYLTYVGRTDDVFKASDYRISPFELESVLLEHAAVAEAAVVPSPDALRLAVPKAFVILAAGASPDADTARSILQHCRDRLPPFQRVRRLEFADLPKTISGKIRRVELRTAEHAPRPVGPQPTGVLGGRLLGGLRPPSAPRGQRLGQRLGQGQGPDDGLPLPFVPVRPWSSGRSRGTRSPRRPPGSRPSRPGTAGRWRGCRRPRRRSPSGGPSSTWRRRCCGTCPA